MSNQDQTVETAENRMEGQTAENGEEQKQDQPEEVNGEKGKKNKKEKEKRSVGMEILSWVMTLLGAVLVALVIRSVIFEPVRVDGASMNDTLADGEIMFVTKFDYSTTWFSFPWQSAEDQEKAARWTIGGNPNRYDVVVCRYPGRGATNFVKRVIGLPGDTIELREGYLYLNGEKVEEPYISDEYRTGRLNTFGPYTVPEGKYFVMGDHRNNSNDSRSVGPIDRSMIIGHVRQVVFPFNKWRGVQ